MASETQAICDWINAIDSTVKALNLTKVNPHSIDGALCGNVISRLSELKDNGPTATRWITRSLTLRKNNKANTYKWSTLFDEISQELEIDLSTAEVPAHHNTPTKALPLWTDGAGGFYTMDHLQKAFFLSQQRGNQPVLPKGGGTQPSGNTAERQARQRLCPVCKMTHPGGLQTCPVWESQTKAIVEVNRAKSEA
eukprot:1266228-Rhodomonas_salina.2